MQAKKPIPTKTKRYAEIDFVKFAAIIFMIFVHTYEVYAYDAFFDSPDYEKPVLYALNFIIEFLGGAPAAPVFMFCMGVGISFSRTTDMGYTTFLKKGVMLLLVGFLVNFLEQVLPVFWSVSVTDTEEILKKIPALFANDVYFFFCLTFFFFAFAFAVKKPVLVCSIAIVLCLIGGFVLPNRNFASDGTVANLLFGLFVRTDDYSFFPLASWIIFPTSGYLFGLLLTNTEDKAGLYKKAAALASAVLVLTTVIGLSLGYENSMLNALECEDADYYAPNFFSQLWAVAFVMLWIALSWTITHRMKNGKFKCLVEWGSRNIKPIYVIQWLVLALMTPFLELSYNIFFTIVACILATVLTFGATKLYLQLKTKRKVD